MTHHLQKNNKINNNKTYFISERIESSIEVKAQFLRLERPGRNGSDEIFGIHEYFDTRRRVGRVKIVTTHPMIVMGNLSKELDAEDVSIQ